MGIIDQIANPQVAPVGQMIDSGSDARQQRQLYNLDRRIKESNLKSQEWQNKVAKMKIMSSQIAEDIESISDENDYQRLINKYEKLDFDLSNLKTNTGDYLPLKEAMPILQDIKESAVNTVEQQQAIKNADSISRQQTRRRELQVRFRNSNNPTTRKDLLKEIKEIDNFITKLNTASESPLSFTQPEAGKFRLLSAQSDVENLVNSYKVPGEEDELVASRLDLGDPEKPGSDYNFLVNTIAETVNAVSRKAADSGIGTNESGTRRDVLSLSRKHIIDSRTDIPILGKTTLPFKQDFKLDREGFIKDIERSFGLPSGSLTSTESNSKNNNNDNDKESGGEKIPDDILKSAQDAIANGADKKAVIKRLKDNGYDVSEF